jgi:hypothetical protein
MTRADAASLATAAEPLSYTLNLKLADPADADAFANAYDNSNTSASAPFLNSWQNISFNAANLVRNEQRVLLIGSSAAAPHSAERDQHRDHRHRHRRRAARARRL